VHVFSLGILVGSAVLLGLAYIDFLPEVPFSGTFVPQIGSIGTSVGEAIIKSPVIDIPLETVKDIPTSVPHTISTIDIKKPLYFAPLVAVPGILETITKIPSVTPEKANVTSTPSVINSPAKVRVVKIVEPKVVATTVSKPVVSTLSGNFGTVAKMAPVPSTTTSTSSSPRPVLRISA
jgi:hypothetical protein